MSFPSPALQKASDTPVGQTVYTTDLGPVVTLADKAVYLRSGSVVLPSSASPLAANVKYLTTVGLPNSGLPNSAIAHAATNGSGTWVVVMQDGNAYVSTNYGQTYSTVNANLTAGHLACGVAYNGTTWVIVGSNGGNFSASSSTNPASSWTARYSVAVTGATAGDAKVVWSGTKFVAYCSGTLGGAIHVSTDGFTWGAGGLTAVNMSGISMAVGGGYIFAVTTGGTNHAYSTDHGASWQVQGTIGGVGGMFAGAGSAGLGGAAVAYGSGLFAFYANNGVIFAGAEPSTLTARNFRAGIGSNGMQITHNGSKFLLSQSGGPVWATSDFSSFEVFWAKDNGQPVYASGANGITYGTYTLNLLAGADYIGVPVMQYQGYNGNNPQTVAYYRIK